MGTVVSMAAFKARRGPTVSRSELNYQIRLVELGLQKLHQSILTDPYIEDRESAAIAMIPLQERLYHLRQELKKMEQG